MPAGIIILPVLFLVIIGIVVAFRKPLTRAVLVTTEIIVLMLVVLLTIAGVFAGYGFGTTMGAIAESDASLAFAVIGGLSGFVLAALLAFFVLTLAQIERNTRAPH